MFGNVEKMYYICFVGLRDKKFLPTQSSLFNQTTKVMEFPKFHKNYE